jgi:hypothetical protein
MGWLYHTNSIAKALHLAAAAIVVAATLWAIVSASRTQKKTYV